MANSVKSADTQERLPLDIRTIPLRGVHLIEASAGTGKTYTITSLILRFLVEEELPIKSILAVTFTNAATAELKGRVYERILTALEVLSGRKSGKGDPALERLLEFPDRERARRLLEEAARDVDCAAIFTIHGFAARMLSDHAFESGTREDTELVGDQRALVLDVVTDFWASHVATIPEQTFEQLGGTWFFRTLVRVGLAAARAEDVPLVDLVRPADLEERVVDLERKFVEAKAQFKAHGRELRDLLMNSTSLNRAIYKPPSIAKDYLAYLSYFERGTATVGHPETERWTETKVEASLKKNQIPLGHPLLGVLEALYEAYQKAEIAVREFGDHLRADLCRVVRERVVLEHERAGTQSFDGLLHGLLAALRGEQGTRLASAIRSQFAVGLIDEFQDTDPVQYEIFRRVYVDGGSRAQSKGALYLIGDPKQSIYAFRGADVRTYLRAASEASAGHWTLATSYRASPRLVRAQNVLFGAPRDAFCVPGIEYQTVASRSGADDLLVDKHQNPLPGIVLLEIDEVDEPAALRHTAQEVGRFLSAQHQIQGRPVTPGDIAVLTRTNRQAQDVQALLRQQGIPAVMHGDRSVFEAPEALELRRVLLALAEPGNRVLARTALATRFLGLSASDLSQLDEDAGLLERWTTDLRTWGHLWKSRGIAHAMEALATATGLFARSLGDRDGERRMTNFRHLLELLHEAQTREHLGVAGLLRYFEGAIADPSSFAMAAEARQLRLESDAQAVTLTTAHKSKGLEYNVVFLPSLGLADRGFHDEAFRYFDIDKDAALFEMRHKDSRGVSEEIHSTEEKQEALRLAYVALTRAKHHVVALVPPTKTFSSLHYLLHERDSGIPGGLLEISTRLKKLPPEGRRAEMARLAAVSEGALECRVITLGGPPKYEKESRERTLVEPPSIRQLRESEKTSSFSAMTRGGQGGLSRAAREGHDIDEVSVDKPDVGSAVLSKAELRSVLAEFPRGARPGDALHAVFELSPFAEGTPQERLDVAHRELSRRGFGKDLVAAVALSVEDVLKTPLPSDRASAPILLGELGRNDRAPEMEFSIPVGGPEKLLSPARLVRALGYEEEPPNAPLGTSPGKVIDGVLTPEYLRVLSSLSFSAWSGFLRGFMDLVYVWEGQLFGLDYKSNYLGEFYTDYTPEALQAQMEEHHYLLQALLYAVAIHRYGTSRIANYSYDEHFGGMHYLFVRGMHPDVPGSGVYSYRPSREVIEGLSSALSEMAS